MSFEPAIDIGDISGCLSSGTYVSSATHTYVSGFALSDHTDPIPIEFTSGSYVSLTSKIYTEAFDIGDHPTTFVQDFGIGYCVLPVKTFGTQGVKVLFASLPIVEGDDAVEIVFGDVLLAAFTGSPLQGTAPLAVQFQDKSHTSYEFDQVSGIQSWLWNFGDGGTSTEEDPQHTYVRAGTYTVSLKISKGDYSDTETREDYVTVTQPLTHNEYKVVLTNKKPYPSKIGGDYIISKIDVFKNNRKLSYMKDIPIELWLSWGGSWTKYEDTTTGTYGNCVVTTSTNYITSTITNCLGYAIATIDGKTYTSNLMRYNFYGSVGP